MPRPKTTLPTLALGLLLLGATAEVAAQVASFRASNYQELFIRHRDFLGFAEPIEASDALGRKDATYWIRPGLAGRCASLESYNFPGHFLRHSGFRIRLDKESPDNLYKEDATWCVVDGFVGNGTKSLQSFNHPDHYLRHRNFELWLDKADPSELFKRDGSFLMQWGSLPARTDLALNLDARVTRDSGRSEVHLSGTGFSPNARVEFRVEGLEGMRGPRSTGIVETTRSDGSFGERVWVGRTWQPGGDAQIRAIDHASGLSARKSIPPLH